MCNMSFLQQDIMEARTLAGFKVKTLDIKSSYCYILSILPTNREYPSAYACWVNEQVIYYLIQAFYISVYIVLLLKNGVVTAKFFFKKSSIKPSHLFL